MLAWTHLVRAATVRIVLGIMAACAIVLVTAANPNEISSEQDYDRSLEELKVIAKSGDRLRSTILADKLAHWAQIHGNMTELERGTTNIDLLFLTKEFDDLAIHAAMNNQSALSTELAREAVAILAKQKDFPSQLSSYDALSQLLKVQWINGDALSAKTTAEKISQIGFRWIAESALNLYKWGNKFSFGVIPGDEGRTQAAKMWIETMNYMIVALRNAPEDRVALAESVLLRKGLVSEIARSAFVTSQTDGHTDQMLIEAIRQNVADKASLAYSSKINSNHLIGDDDIPMPFGVASRYRQLQSELLINYGSWQHNVRLPDVAKTLSPKTLVITYVRYGGQEFKVPEHYLAIAMNNSGLVGVTDIGPAERVDSLIHAMCRTIANDVDPLFECRQSGGHEENSNIPAKIHDVGRDLYDALLGSLDKEVTSAERLVISPDDAMDFLPFETLVTDNDRFLVMDHVVSYVDSVIELLRWEKVIPSGGPPVIVGAPEFSGRENETQQACDQSARDDNAADRPGISEATPEFLWFTPLCGSSREIERIHDTLREAIILSGNRATVDAVKHLQGPRILHFATHGFALGDLTWSDTWRKSVPDWRDTDFNILRDDPMVRGGLALAGANVRAGPGGRDDGILSAGEVRYLQLAGTQLVVLSACDSGLGPWLGSEGVLGLRSAFREAGARAVTFALWGTGDDEKSQNFIVQYYQALKTPIGKTLIGNADALAKVKRSFIEQGVEPWVWANLVAYGYPGPLAQ